MIYRSRIIAVGIRVIKKNERHKPSLMKLDIIMRLFLIHWPFTVPISRNKTLIITLNILTKETARNTQQRSVKEYLISSWSEFVWLVAEVGKKIRTNRRKRGPTFKYHVI